VESTPFGPRTHLQHFSPIFPVGNLRRALSCCTRREPKTGDGSIGWSAATGGTPVSGKRNWPDCPGVMRARPLVFTAWDVGAGRLSPTQALDSVAEARDLTEAISERARAAFSTAPR
jgi:hypothetical protein